jgi:hypothetical protein
MQRATSTSGFDEEDDYEFTSISPIKSSHGGNEISIKLELVIIEIYGLGERAVGRFLIRCPTNASADEEQPSSSGARLRRTSDDSSSSDNIPTDMPTAASLRLTCWIRQPGRKHVCACRRLLHNPPFDLSFTHSHTHVVRALQRNYCAKCRRTQA